MSVSDNVLYGHLILLGREDRNDVNNPHRHIVGETQIYQSANGITFMGYGADAIARYYESALDDLLSVESKKRLLSVFKRLLRDHPEIGEDEIIGGKFGMAKKFLLSQTSLCFSLTLAAFMRHTVLIRNPHRDDFKGYKSVVEKYYDETTVEDIDLSPLSAVLPDDRDTSEVDKAGFDRLFRKIKTENIEQGKSARGDVRMYILNYRNSRLDLEGLSRFLEDNIEHYVMSSLEEKGYFDSGRVKHLTHNAIKRFADKTVGENFVDTYSKLMLYVFMECGLGAPKLFNAIEVKDQNIRSDGVYYLKKGVISDKPMLVLGTSHTFPSLSEAIENSLVQAEAISKRQGQILNLVNPAFLSRLFDKDDMAFIVNRLLNPENSALESDVAFGVFASYSIDEKNDGSLTQQEFVEKISKRLENDISFCIPGIRERIRFHGLQNYSFFIFVLPLTNVQDETRNIIEGFRGGEENA